MSLTLELLLICTTGLVEVDVDPLNSASRAADRCESDVWSWPRVKVAEEEDSARIADRVRGVGRVVVLLLA